LAPGHSRKNAAARDIMKAKFVSIPDRLAFFALHQYAG